MITWIFSSAHILTIHLNHDLSAATTTSTSTRQLQSEYAEPLILRDRPCLIPPPEHKLAEFGLQRGGTWARPRGAGSASLGLGVGLQAQQRLPSSKSQKPTTRETETDKRLFPTYSQAHHLIIYSHRPDSHRILPPPPPPRPRLSLPTPSSCPTSRSASRSSVLRHASAARAPRAGR